MIGMNVLGGEKLLGVGMLGIGRLIFGPWLLLDSRVVDVL